LHTPEVKALLDQWSVLGCRLVDAAASGRNKRLVHDVSAMIYSGCELLADPSTTLALAEVTAYLCHALEMEDAAMHQGDKDDADKQAARRHERDTYQKSTYVDPILLQHLTTVEQVILSSLGVPRAPGTAFGTGDVDEDDGDGRSVPKTVVVDDAANATWEQSSVRQQIDDTRSQQSQSQHEDMDNDQLPEEEEMYQKARNNINISLLQEQMSKRSANIERTEPLPPYSGKPPVSRLHLFETKYRNTARAPNKTRKRRGFRRYRRRETVEEGHPNEPLQGHTRVRGIRLRYTTEVSGQQDDIEWPNLVDHSHRRTKRQSTTFTES
jgi:hypothetical protein